MNGADMNTFFPRKRLSFRSRFAAALAAIFALTGLILRLVLFTAFPDMLPLSANLPEALLLGVVNDAAALAFIMPIPVAALCPCSDAFLQKRSGRLFCLALLFLFCAVFIFSAFAEYLFWDEFRSRFNFIAVDYLIYTTEVVRNIVESYPLARLLAAVALLAAGVTTGVWALVRDTERDAPAPSSFRNRLAALGGLTACAAAVFLFFTPLSLSQDRSWNEFAKNGVYELFSAFRHNQLDYRAFYRTMDAREAFALMRAELAGPAQARSLPADSGLIRTIAGQTAGQTAGQPPNVIVVVMESMGDKWLGEYTPNLSRLAREGLSFSNMLATGTRTVRGLEAVMLSVPPTPGNSIVRRPDNDGLFSLGTLFRNRGYGLTFIYGGIGYFDNMNDFFSGNGYRVVDKLDFAPQSKTFSTAWGQCDGDLFTESLLRADQSHATGRPFHQVLLTTSNHRPFTYPEGKIDIPPGTGRRGAIKYSDHAIGAFMEQAREKPWFNNTVFLFIGDHPSAIAGKTEVPADAYGIVCILYGPRFFAPERVDTLCSQIDAAPTLLAALGWEYDSQFFGRDARALPREDGRAWISTYQLLGFRDNNRLVVLKPNGEAELTPLPGDGARGADSGGTTPPRRLSAADKAFIDRAVASYQCAYDLFTDKKMKERAVAAFAQGVPGARANRMLSSSAEMK